MKFDWIDFGTAWGENDRDCSAFEKLSHTSTASLMSQILRRREVPFRKVFCWMRRDADILEQSNMASVRRINASFPYKSYANSDNAQRLAIFANWLIKSLASGAPELISQYEVTELFLEVSRRHYVYHRREKLKSEVGGPKCVVEYIHTPTDLSVVVSCVVTGGIRLTRTVQHEKLRRHELVYGRAITKATVRSGAMLVLDTYFGEI